MSSAIRNILEERGKQYGEYHNQAKISQELKAICRMHILGTVQAYQMEALDMIMHKIARILNGNPNYADSWQDIAGYAQLVVDRIGVCQIGEQNKETRKVN